MRLQYSVLIFSAVCALCVATPKPYIYGRFLGDNVAYYDTIASLDPKSGNVTEIIQPFFYGTQPMAATAIAALSSDGVYCYGGGDMMDPLNVVTCVNVYTKEILPLIGLKPIIGLTYDAEQQRMLIATGSLFGTRLWSWSTKPGSLPERLVQLNANEEYSQDFYNGVVVNQTYYYITNPSDYPYKIFLRWVSVARPNEHVFGKQLNCPKEIIAIALAYDNIRNKLIVYGYYQGEANQAILSFIDLVDHSCTSIETNFTTDDFILNGAYDKVNQVMYSNTLTALYAINVVTGKVIYSTPMTQLPNSMAIIYK